MPASMPATAARGNPLLAILVADLRQRTRSTRFRVVALLAAFGAWWCFPPPQAGYLVLEVHEHYRGMYSSAWVGMVLAMMTMLWSLAGFYVVRGTVQRDFDTRVWQLLGASSMSRTGYLVAKWVSHVLVLGLILTITLGVGLAAQWVRAEDRHVDLWELAKPGLFISLPILAVCATFAIWFDLVPRLRRTAGNVLFFFVWLTILSSGGMQAAKNDEAAKHAHPAHAAQASTPARDPGWASDLAGLALVQNAIEAQLKPQFPGQAMDGFCVGCGPAHGAVQRFVWPRWEASPALLAGRVLWLALALGGVLLAVPWLDAAASRAGPAGESGRTRAPRQWRWLRAALAPLRRFPFGTLVAAEIDVLLRMRPLWWWAAWVPLWAGQAVGTAQASALCMLGAWTLLLDAFSRTGLREHEHRTGELVWSAPGAAHRLVRARAAMLIGLATIAVAPGLLHAAVHGAGVATTATAFMIAASLSLGGLALATLTHGSRPFELAFLVAAYATTQGASWLAADAHGTGVLAFHAAAALASIAILALPRTLRGSAR